MATKKKTIVWANAVKKALGSYDRKQDKVFSDFEKEAAKRPISLAERNLLWNKKYQPKIDALEKAIDAAYKKLYYKYHNPNGTPKSGYIIK